MEKQHTLPMIVTKGGPQAQTNSRFIQCIKYILFATNLAFFVIGCGLLGICIWMVVDRTFMQFISGNALYAASIYIALGVTVIVIFMSFLGLVSVLTENRFLLMVYCGILAFMFLLMFICIIMAGVFSGQLGEAIRDKMKDTLINNYGVEFHDYGNQLITHAWDAAQEKLDCCGVDDSGWRVYLESKWFENQVWNPEDQKPYVPRSCCLKDRFWRFIDTEMCQKWKMGPPGSPDNGAINRALYYDGCFTAAKRLVAENATIILSLMSIFAICILCGAICSFILCLKLKRLGR